jgi:hypothetical protein
VKFGGQQTHWLWLVQMIETEKQAPQDSDKRIEPSPLATKFARDSLAVYLYCCVFAVILKGWRTFFVGLGLTPIVTLAELFVMALVPFVSGWVVTTALSFIFKKLSFYGLWLRTSTTIFLVTLLVRYHNLSNV